MRRIERLILENFQSHAHTELAVAPTLTVITGESDQGKSAIIRALRWLLYNEPRGADFIRTGSSTCRVTLVYDDGIRITRERNASGTRNRYVIARPGEEDLVFEKVGNSVPDAVVEITGVKKLLLDDTEELSLHLALQLDPPFLLSRPGSVRAKAIGSLARTEVFDAAHRRTALDIRRAEDKAKRLDEEIAAVDRQLEEFADLAPMAQAIERLQGILIRLKKTKERADALKGLWARWQDVRERLDLVTQKLEALAVLDRAEAVLARCGDGFSRLTALAKIADGWQRTTARLQAAGDVLARTEQVFAAKEKAARLEFLALHLARLKDAGKRLARINRQRATVEKVCRATAGVPPAEAVMDAAGQKYERYRRLVEASKRLGGIRRSLASVERVVAGTEGTGRALQLLERAGGIPSRLESLRRLHGQWQRNSTQLQAAEGRSREALARLRALGEEYRQVLVRAGRCPVCASPIDGETAGRIAAAEAELAQGGLGDEGNKS